MFNANFLNLQIFRTCIRIKLAMSHWTWKRIINHSRVYGFYSVFRKCFWKLQNRSITPALHLIRDFKIFVGSNLKCARCRPLSVPYIADKIINNAFLFFSTSFVSLFVVSWWNLAIFMVDLSLLHTWNQYMSSVMKWSARVQNVWKGMEEWNQPRTFST